MIELDKKRKREILVRGSQPTPVNVGTPRGSAIWGKIYGNMKNQADLMKMLKKIHKTAKAAL